MCEVCSHVSVRYVEPAVRLYPDDEPADDPVVFEARITLESMGRSPQCRYCSQTAVYLIPEGLTCNEHAWQAAARLDWISADVWVPIPIHPSNA